MLDEMFQDYPRCWGHGMKPRMSFGMLEALGYTRCMVNNVSV